MDIFIYYYWWVYIKIGIIISEKIFGDYVYMKNFNLFMFFDLEIVYFEIFYK